MVAITKAAIAKRQVIVSMKAAAAIVMAATPMDLIGQTAATVAVLAELASPTTSCNDLNKIIHLQRARGGDDGEALAGPFGGRLVFDDWVHNARRF